MMINGHTRTCGLIGNPVAHTLSPAIHGFLAAKTGQNLAYLPFHVQPEAVGEAVKGAYALNFLGLNVTIPYKSAVIPYLTEVDQLAARIGAVNTLVRTDAGYKGYNTDMPGLYRAMCSDGVAVEGQRVIVLGAGGVARAVVMMLSTKGAKEIVILNRTLERAEKIAEEINGMLGEQLVTAKDLSGWKHLQREEKYLVIQATDVGMHPHTEETLIEDPAFYQMVSVGYDLIFRPLETKFMQKVRQAGGEAFNGFKMLLYQGIIAFELWTGTSISEELAELTRERVLGEMQG